MCGIGIKQEMVSIAVELNVKVLATKTNEEKKIRQFFTVE